MAGGRGRGRRGQVPNEEVPYHERNVRDVTIEDLARQVARVNPASRGAKLGERSRDG
jgi:hypothetical protein